MMEASESDVLVVIPGSAVMCLGGVWMCQVGTSQNLG